jgi:hypothetical protein
MFYRFIKYFVYLVKMETKSAHTEMNKIMENCNKPRFWSLAFENKVCQCITLYALSIQANSLAGIMKVMWDYLTTQRI